MKRSLCTSCFDRFCVGGKASKKDFCPAHIHPEVLEKARRIYAKDKNVNWISVNSAKIEASGYIRWPRLKDMIEFARLMKYKNIGVVFCPDLWNESKKAVRIIHEQHLKSFSRVCRVCSKEVAFSFEAFANEINMEEPQFVMGIGLCVTAEANLIRHIQAPYSTFVAKDAAFHNCPALSVYTSLSWKDWTKDVYAKHRHK